MIAFAGCIAAAIYFSQRQAASDPGIANGTITNTPNFAWWTIAYMFCCIVGVIIVSGLDAVQTYHVAICAYMSAGLVLTTSSINSVIVAAQSGKEAASAGFILLAIVCVSRSYSLNIK